MDLRKGQGTVPMQTADATICSNDSAYATGNTVIKSVIKTGGKIKAYVDFSDFNRNYEEYIAKNGKKESSDEYMIFSDIDDSSAPETKMVLERQSSGSSNQSDWEILSCNSADRPVNME